jgi:tRNA dimethylallyltransferase
MNTGHLPKLALIAGPTASGKSALALALAERHDGVVINADSAQVYRDLRVLSARPSPEEERRAPHRLFGYIDGAEGCSAAHWAADARGAIGEAVAEDRLPILVGGTGLYLRTLLDGIAPVPAIDPAVRERVRALPVAAAFDLLGETDPAAAARLNAADTTRVARALEVALSTGRTLADWQAERAGGIAGQFDLAPIILTPDRNWLIARCDQRLAAMFADGATDEVRALLARALPASAPVMRAIGVPEIAAMLAGEIDEATALERARLATRRYAKRQYTWFRNQPPTDWARLDAVDDAAVDRLSAMLSV